MTNQLLQLIIQQFTSPHLDKKQISPITKTMIDATEQMLGCTFPELLRTMYISVGNGGFGHNCSLLPLEELFVVFTQQNKRYLQAFGDDPPGLTYLVAFDWGCNVYSCIDCSTPSYPVLRSDGMSGFFFPESDSFDAWLIHWMYSDNLWDRVMEKEAYNCFVQATNLVQTINPPLLHVLNEWIDTQVLQKSENSME